MHVVEPKVFFLAETDVNINDVNEYLVYIGAVDWPEPDYKSSGEFLAEIAGRTCYKSFGTKLNANLTRVRSDHHEYIGNILSTHHGSVLEHCTATVAMVDVSRVLTHELVRHRPGSAYSQESMRFVRLDDIGMYVPQCIQENPYAYAEFQYAVVQAEQSYKRLVKLMITDDMPFSKKKEITSALRRIAPSGHSTTIVVTNNHRGWRHQIETRTAPGAEEEIVKVFGLLAEMFVEKYPAFYQDMSKSPHEGKPNLQHYTFEHSKI